MSFSHAFNGLQMGSLDKPDRTAEEERSGVLAGLEDALAGRTIPHSQVKEWAATLLATLRSAQSKQMDISTDLDGSGEHPLSTQAETTSTKLR
jgi:hypothetical protein